MTTEDTSNGEVQVVNRYLISVRVADEWGFARPDGQMIWPAMYSAYLIFFHGLIAVQFDGLWGFLDEQGKEIIEPRYEEIDFESAYPLMHVVRDGKHGFVNRRAEEVIPCQYRYCYAFTEQVFTIYAAENGKAGILCADGRELTTPLYDTIYINPPEAARGLFSVVRDDRYGLVNEVGQEVIPCHYEAIKCFENTELLLLQEDERWAICTRQHEFKTDFVFTDWMYTHVEGAFLIQKENRWGLVSETGAEIIPVQYEAIHELKPGVFAVLDNDGFVRGFDGQGNSLTATGNDHLILP